METQTADIPQGGRHASDLIQVGPNRMRPYNEPTRAAVVALQDKHNITASTIAKDIGKSLSALSKYLNKKPEGDVFKLEALLEDYCANFEKRREAKIAIFPTAVTDEVENALETIRKTNDMGLITGPAGIGKTCGGDLYCAKFPTATMITIARHVRATPSGIVRALWAAGGAPNARGKSHYEYLVEKYEGTNRIIIVDNAHLLSKSGLGFWFDFHDETESPICLKGNPEIIDRIASNDQQFSRIGVHWKIEAPENDLEIPVRRTIQQWFPDDIDELYKLSFQVASNLGHLRALKKQLRLAQEMRTNNPDLTPIKAFRSAHTMLIRGYKLKD